MKNLDLRENGLAGEKRQEAEVGPDPLGPKVRFGVGLRRGKAFQRERRREEGEGHPGDAHRATEPVGEARLNLWPETCGEEVAANRLPCGEHHPDDEQDDQECDPSRRFLLHGRRDSRSTATKFIRRV